MNRSRFKWHKFDKMEGKIAKATSSDDMGVEHKTAICIQIFVMVSMCK
jgi:hypothetical protein